MKCVELAFSRFCISALSIFRCALMRPWASIDLLCLHWVCSRFSSDIAKFCVKVHGSINLNKIHSHCDIELTLSTWKTRADVKISKHVPLGTSAELDRFKFLSRESPFTSTRVHYSNQHPTVLCMILGSHEVCSIFVNWCALIEKAS